MKSDGEGILNLELYVKAWNQNDGRSVNGRGQYEGQPMRGCQRVES